MAKFAGKQTVHIYVPTFKEACELLRYLPEAEIQDCHKGTISGKKTGITATLKSTWADSYTRSDEGEIPHDESVVVHYMDGVFARSIVNVTYQNGDAYLGDEASLLKPTDTSTESVICNLEGGNNVYTSPLVLQTTQQKTSK